MVSVTQWIDLVASVSLADRLSVLTWLNRLTFDLYFWYRGRPWPWLGWDCRSRSYAKGQGQMPKIAFWHHCYIALRSKVGVKVMGHSRSDFWCIAVDIRGSAKSAAKTNKSYYQSKVFVCMSVIRGRIRRITRMRLIGFQLTGQSKARGVRRP